MWEIDGMKNAGEKFRSHLPASMGGAGGMVFELTPGENENR